VADRYFRVKAKERESSFLTIHYLAREEFQIGIEKPANLKDLIKLHPVCVNLTRQFSDLEYAEDDERGFTLQERDRHHISLFYTDKLYGDSDSMPRWVFSGLEAHK
jgi:hypothetical protein